MHWRVTANQDLVKWSLADRRQVDVRGKSRLVPRQTIRDACRTLRNTSALPIRDHAMFALVITSGQDWRKLTIDALQLDADLGCNDAHRLRKSDMAPDDVRSYAFREFCFAKADAQVT